MGKMEWCCLDSIKQDHEAIVSAIHDLERLGYMVSGISRKNGALEIICYPPRREGGKEESPHQLSMDGVSETFRP